MANHQDPQVVYLALIAVNYYVLIYTMAFLVQQV